MPVDTSLSAPSPAHTNSGTTASAHANVNRPQMRPLSATTTRAINRSPLTPKIASKAPQPPTTLATAATPAGRRPQALTIANSNHDDSSFPHHLGSTVTPRSGARQSRVNSVSTTPNTTPNVDRSDAWESRSSFGLPSPRIDGDQARRSVPSFASIHSDVNLHARPDSTHPAESKFFHASDVKPSRPTPASRPTLPKASTFFYANGNTAENKSPHQAPSSPAPGHSQDNLPSKFMYANGTPELRQSPPPPVSRSSGSTVSTAPKAPTSRPGTNPPAAGHPSSQRPNSPTKPLSPAPQTLQKPGNGLGTGRPPILSPQLAPSPPGLRRSSSGAPRPSRHSRSASLVKVDPFPTVISPVVALSASPEASSPVSLSPSRAPPLTLASIIQAAEDFAENEAEDEASTPAEETESGVQSPARSAHSAEPVSELVANARRERKVQDLQIRNASLEAINRTLERRLRKQTAELRRFKRLSLVGLSSLSSNPLSGEASAGALPEPQDITAANLGDLGEEDAAAEDEEGEEEEEEKADEAEESCDSDSASESLSPSAIAERDIRHRKRDEQRLQLDLSKHQQVLVDSQKINQSIRRCLDWTDALIDEGKRALQYRVRVSDVPLGGRVLLPPDEEDERPASADSFRDDTVTLGEKSLEERISSVSWGIGSQDRDSGIELGVDGG
ncbi:hypothetical protein GGS23DRAFT_584689 [Durotheca rogersii]|uniref:uncharacterized protein n=1 Tax=Durotheca rogersii TaxID=419775 RepID=UPI00221EE3E3|nr:uncharacterized protein GGS23DRAFT_584689 [Durotheca rogersii]KAI5859683.1 hypothetical protein GGS23DRAFT_584689 [Durotheca rogersii]